MELKDKDIDRANKIKNRLVRESRVLGHIKSQRKPLSSKDPTLNDMLEGEERYSIINGILRLYVKQQGQLWYFEGTKA